MIFYVYVVVQFYPWLKFLFSLKFVWGIAIYDNDFQTKENKIQTKDKIEPQHISPTVFNHFMASSGDNYSELVEDLLSKIIKF